MIRVKRLTKQPWKKRKKNEKNRTRNILLNVNVSQMQKDEINRRVYLTGRLKREYIIQSALEQQCYILGNHHLVERIDERLEELIPKLEAIEKGEQLDEPVLEELRTIYEITENWE